MVGHCASLLAKISELSDRYRHQMSTKWTYNAVTGTLGSWYGKCPIIRLHVHLPDGALSEWGKVNRAYLWGFR